MDAWDSETFRRHLLAMGERYHIHHPFHVAMAQGTLSKDQVRGWVANRYYYQISIPRKDAAILANCPVREVRRHWIQRIIDHDGRNEGEGGIEAWLRLGEAVGLERQVLESGELILPGVRFAVDAYRNFAAQAPWQEAAASSLTELFAPKIHKQRLDNWPEHYPWVNADGLQYFRNRLSEARRDVEHGLDITLKGFVTRAQQERALEILQFKLDVLWTMLDAMYLAYVADMPPCSQRPVNREEV